MEARICTWCLLTYATSVMFAWLEIEIEGAFAWSRDNPHTWRLALGGICGNKLPLTGYHLTMFLTVFLATFGGYLTSALLMGTSVSVESLCAVGAFYTAVVLLEDNAWYVYNQEFRSGGDFAQRDPFGGFRNRITRYCLACLLFASLWGCSYGGLSADMCADLARVVMTICALLLLERVTLLPLYDCIRARLIKSDRVTAAMNYKLSDSNGRLHVSYCVVPDQPNCS